MKNKSSIINRLPEFKEAIDHINNNNHNVRLKKNSKLTNKQIKICKYLFNTSLKTEILKTPLALYYLKTDSKGEPVNIDDSLLNEIINKLPLLKKEDREDVKIAVDLVVNRNSLFYLDRKIYNNLKAILDFHIYDVKETLTCREVLAELLNITSKELIVYFNIVELKAEEGEFIKIVSDLSKSRILKFESKSKPKIKPKQNNKQTVKKTSVFNKKKK